MLLTFLYNCLSDRRKCKFKDLIMFYINNEFHASDYTHYSILLQCTLQELNDGVPHTPGRCSSDIDPLNTELNPICHLLALLGAHRILYVSRIRVNSGHFYTMRFFLYSPFDLLNSFL